MIGASKIDRHSDDLDRLNEMFEMGLNNSEISRIFRTNKGETLSRIHISHIRRGKRWNMDNHSFIMKDMEKMTVKTTIKNTVYESVVGMVFTHDSTFHIYLTYKDSKPLGGVTGHMMIEKPSINELLEFHNRWIENERTA